MTQLCHATSGYPRKPICDFYDSVYMDLDRERLKGMRKQIKAGATGAVRNLLEDMNVFEDRKKKLCSRHRIVDLAHDGSAGMSKYATTCFILLYYVS